MMASSQEKAVIVTGANAGLGFETSRMLCERGYHVIMACRSEERGKEAVSTIKKLQPEANVEFMKLDLASLASVKQFAESFKSRNLPLDVLINNAGVFYALNDTTRHVSQDGLEMTMATNHIGHFLLTHLLLDCLKSTSHDHGEARVVVITSSLHDFKRGSRSLGTKLLPMEVDDFMLEKEGSYIGKQAYKNSKLANVLFTQELAERLQETGITVNCMCPGFIPRTQLVRHNSAFTNFFLRYVLDGAMKLFTQTITRSLQDGATDMLNLATADQYKGVSGKCFSSGKEESPSEEAMDKMLQQKVWELSETLVDLDKSRESNIATNL